MRHGACLVHGAQVVRRVVVLQGGQLEVAVRLAHVDGHALAVEVQHACGGLCVWRGGEVVRW